MKTCSLKFLHGIILLSLICKTVTSQQTLGYLYKTTTADQAKIDKLYDDKKALSESVEAAKIAYETDSIENQLTGQQLLEKRNEYKNATTALNAIKTEIEKAGGQRVTFFGSASISSSEDIINSASGSGRMSAYCNFGHDFGFFIAYNRIGIRPSTISEDSLDVNSIMFPDAGNTGFMTSINWSPIITQQNNVAVSRILTTLEFALKQTSVETTTITESTDTAGNISSVSETKTVGFTSLNYHLGATYVWTYLPSDNKENAVQAGLGFYIHLLNIPNEDAQYFAEIFKDLQLKDKGSKVFSSGFKFTLQYKGLNFYGDIRQNYKSKLDDTNPLKGTVFNIGTMVSTEIFKL